MVPNSEENSSLPLSADTLAEIATVVETLAGDNILVEVNQA